MRRANLITLAVALSGLGCTDQFNPKGEFEPRLVLYAVMTPGSQTTLVRAHTTYDPPGFNPLDVRSEASLAGASAILSEGRVDHPMRNTLLPHPDPDRYGPSMRGFVLDSFRLVRGGEYSVSVTAPGYPVATGTTIVPDASQFNVRNSTTLGLATNTNQSLSVMIETPKSVRGFLVQLVVEYTILSEGGVLGRTEIAARLGTSPEGTLPIYPVLTPTAQYAGRDFDPVTLYDFELDAWRYSINEIYKRYGSSNLVFRQAVVYLYLVDHHLYSYASIVNGFRDEFSVRTDAPDYSNVKGGVGVIGSYTLDSLSFSIPSKPQ